MRSSKKLTAPSNPSKKHTYKSPTIHFRTIYKPRNDSTLPPAYQEDATLPHKEKSLSQISRTSESTSSYKPKPTLQRGIKDYVRQMKIKKEEPPTPRSQIIKQDSTDLRLSRISSLSKVSQSLSPKEPLPQPSPPMRLQQIEKRVQNLLSAKLDRLKSHRGGIGLSNWQFLKKENQLQPELEQIILKLKGQQNSEQGIKELSSKLELIEKMIASQAIQSELLKDRYFGFKNQRSNISSHQNKLMLASAVGLNQGPKLRNSVYYSEKKAEALSKYISTNRETYSRPGREFYINNKYKHPVYVPNRQILPRSSYSTEFLKYGTMPTFKSRPNTDTLPSHSLAVKASTYQQQFKDKYNLTTNIDFRELDCYKNKFKNPNISFMTNSKKKMLQTVTTLKKTTKQTNNIQVSESKLTKMMSHSTFSDFYKTEQQRNYLGHSASQSELASWMRGQPKNGQLNSLKEALRTSYLRG